MDKKDTLLREIAARTEKGAKGDKGDSGPQGPVGADVSVCVFVCAHQQIKSLQGCVLHAVPH